MSINPDNVKKGDYFAMKYGFDREIFYVVEVCGELVLVTKTNWLVSSACCMTFEELEKRDAKFLARGKINLLRYILFPLKDCIPKYIMGKAKGA